MYFLFLPSDLNVQSIVTFLNLFFWQIQGNRISHRTFFVIFLLCFPCFRFFCSIFLQTLSLSIRDCLSPWHKLHESYSSSGECTSGTQDFVPLQPAWSWEPCGIGLPAALWICGHLQVVCMYFGYQYNLPSEDEFQFP